MSRRPGEAQTSPYLPCPPVSTCFTCRPLLHFSCFLTSPPIYSPCLTHPFINFLIPPFLILHVFLSCSLPFFILAPFLLLFPLLHFSYFVFFVHLFIVPSSDLLPLLHSFPQPLLFFFLPPFLVLCISSLLLFNSYCHFYFLSFTLSVLPHFSIPSLCPSLLQQFILSLTHSFSSPNLFILLFLPPFINPFSILLVFLFSFFLFSQLSSYSFLPSLVPSFFTLFNFALLSYSCFAFLLSYSCFSFFFLFFTPLLLSLSLLFFNNFFPTSHSYFSFNPFFTYSSSSSDSFLSFSSLISPFPFLLCFPFLLVSLLPSTLSTLFSLSIFLDHYHSAFLSSFLLSFLQFFQIFSHFFHSLISPLRSSL